MGKILFSGFIVALIFSNNSVLAQEKNYVSDQFQQDRSQYMSLKITSVKKLSFPVTFTGDNSPIRIDPNSMNAAEFRVRGEPNKYVIVTVENDAQLVNDRNGIKMSKFSFGGSVDEDGVGRIDQSGLLSGITIGGIAYPTSIKNAGKYFGKFKVRVNYK